MISTRTDLDAIDLGAPRAGGVVRSTLLHALAAAFLSLGGLLAFVPAAFISAGIRNGARAFIATVAVAAIFVSGILFIIGEPDERRLHAAEVMLLVLEFGFAAGVAATMMRRRIKAGSVLLAGVAVSCAGFIAVELLLRQFAGFSVYDTVVLDFRAEAERIVTVWKDRGATDDVLRSLRSFSTGLIDRFVPATLIISTIMSFALSLAAIPRLPVGGQVGSAYLFRALKLPEGLLVVFVAAGLSPLASGMWRDIGLNVLAVVIFLYVLQGLAIFRALLANMRLGPIGIAMAFLLLIVMSQYFVSPVLLFLAGLFDPFFDFRNLHRKDESHESDSD